MKELMRVPRAGAAGALAIVAILALSADPSVGQTAREGGRPAKENRATRLADSLDAPPPAVDPDYLGRDTVVAAPGQSYRAGPIRRFLFGDLNRDLWELEVPVPVLDLDLLGGGLTVEELSGGLQTLGIRFRSRDGRTFQFRSIVKNASRAIPSMLRSTPVDDVVEDQMGALFPLSAMVVADLLESAGLLVARPRPVIMPDDPRLGEYREAFAGRMGWIEERPNEAEGDRPGFAGSSKITGSDELLEELAENPSSYVDARAVLEARLIDMLVSDWDRHLDQWRWASFEEGRRTRWEPIPRDRDWALARIDGLLPRLALFYSPKYRGLSNDAPEAWRMSWSAQEIDRRWLTGLERDAFLEVAQELRGELDDEAIERAVGVLPDVYRREVGAELIAHLRARRDALERVAEDFYEHLARWVNVFGTDADEVLDLEARGSDSLRVRIHPGGAPDLVTYERTLHPSETDEIRVYLEGGDDRVVVRGGELPIDVRVVGGAGDDRYEDKTSGHRFHVYDAEGDPRLDLGPDAYFTDSPHASQEAPPIPYFAWDTRDWGHVWVPRPAVRFDSDMGLYVGLGASRYGFGFGYEPYRSRYSVEVLSGFAPEQWVGDLEFERPFGDRGWRAGLSLDWATQRPTWFYGLGNEVEVTRDEGFFQAHRNQASAWLWGQWAPDSTTTWTFGPSVRVAGPVHGEGTVFDTLRVYGTDSFHQVGVEGRGTLDTRDSYAMPRKGVVLRLDGRAYPALLDVEDAFVAARAEARAYLSGDMPAEPALHLRLLGERAWGRAPYADLPFLGGSGSLPGYVERRFLGDRAVSASALLRIGGLPAHVLTDVRIGVHGLATVGRVWISGEESGRWHPGFGGGLWIHVLAMDRVVSLTHVRGRDGSSAFYLDLGFPF